VNIVVFTLSLSFSDAQKAIIAVSNEKRQIVKKYCHSDSKRLIFAIFSAEKRDVYSGINIKEMDFAAILLTP
jgi:hypothetical protein